MLRCCLCFVVIATTVALRYDYGDGTYYIGNVAEDGKPSGRGQFYNSSGALGKNVEIFKGQLKLYIHAMISFLVNIIEQDIC